MIRPITLALLALTLPAAAQNAPSSFAERFAAHAPLSQRSTTPTLKPAATITGEFVRIGDLVENAGALAHIAIFRAPELGESGRVSVDRVFEAVLPHELFKIDTRGLTDIVVTRASTTISPKDIETRVAQALAGRQRSTDASNLTLTFDAEPRAIHLEPGAEMRLMRMAFDPRTGRFDVTFERPGTRVPLRYTGTYAETFEATVLTRPLAAGEIVRTNDIAIVRRPRTEFAANIIGGSEQVVGLAARRAMRPGEMLRQNDLTKPEVIARNDNVTITYQVPGITLTMRGKALEGGSIGDNINVLNVLSKRSMQGTIAGPGHVIITAPTLVNIPAPAPRLAAHTNGRATPAQPRASAE
jgi:flagellar basal body P-ring formation protein FlgA